MVEIKVKRKCKRKKKTGKKAMKLFHGKLDELKKKKNINKKDERRLVEFFFVYLFQWSFFVFVWFSFLLVWITTGLFSFVVL